MPSKTIVQRQRLDRALRTSLLHHEAALLSGLRERLEPLLEGDESVLQSFDQLYRFFLRLLERRESGLVAADEAHSAEQRDDEAPRQRRDEAAEKLYGTLVQVRRAAIGHLGPTEATRLLDLDGDTSVDPLMLHRQAARALTRLRNPEVPTPPNELPGDPPDREAWATRLEPEVAALGAALEEVGEQERLFALTVAAKKAATEAHDLDTQAISRCLQGFLLLAGRRDLAGQVRPARLRRRSRSDSTPSGPGQEGGPADATPESSDSSVSNAPDDATPENTAQGNPSQG